MSTCHWFPWPTKCRHVGTCVITTCAPPIGCKVLQLTAAQSEKLLGRVKIMTPNNINWLEKHTHTHTHTHTHKSWAMCIKSDNRMVHNHYQHEHTGFSPPSTQVLSANLMILEGANHSLWLLSHTVWNIMLILQQAKHQQHDLTSTLIIHLVGVGVPQNEVDLIANYMEMHKLTNFVFVF